MLPPGQGPRLRKVLPWAGLLACLFLLPLSVHAETGPTPAQVAQAVAERRSAVAEFQVIKAAAQELGLRVWLFGGTAAGFAHYVRWDLAREGGDPRYRQSFFDYDFTNIYRSTQDADLVVDGTPEQAEALESLVKGKMGFLQGSKDHWEVRLLRQDRVAPGGQVKQALLANPDFLGQNTDSNSTGMIELTDPPAGESVVRDLRDWESGEPFFLEDVTLGRLHYYWSESHQSTSRFREGHNPELFSVIRYLVKAFQYDLQVEGEDLARVKAVIDAFDRERDYPALSGWAKGWLERYGPNLIRHSVDVEYAWETLERLGLRQKLISLSDPSQVGTLGWWLSREPLRTRPVGEGTGRTAAELGLEIVAHETQDFLAYESITRDTTLRPNVLISRPDHPGENAVLGPGFYTQRGRMGARGTGLTIRFTVDPRAREGEDFTVFDDGRVLFTNRAALQVIPESLNISIRQFFEMLRDGVQDPTDRGVWTKLRRRLAVRAISPEDEAEIVSIASQAIGKVSLAAGTSIIQSSRESNVAVVSEWFSLPIAPEHPELLRQLIGRPGKFAVYAAQFILPRPGWERHPEILRELIERRQTRLSTAIARNVLSQERWSGHPELLESLLDQRRLVGWHVLSDALSKPFWKEHPEFVERMLARSRTNLDGILAQSILSQPHWADHPEWVWTLLERGDKFAIQGVAQALALPHWKDHPELVLALLERLSRGRRSLSYRWQYHLNRLGPGYHRLMVELAFYHLAGATQVLELVSLPQWRDDPTLRALCGGQVPTFACVQDALRDPSARAEALGKDLAALSKAGGNECP